MTSSDALSRSVREQLLHELSSNLNLDQPVAVPLSGGLDSTTILLALRVLGVEVVAFTFMLDGHASRDWLTAAENAKRLGVRHLTQLLPRDPARLRADVECLIRERGLRRKTDIECIWPFLYLVERIANEKLAQMSIGFGVDRGFGLSKKAMMHHRATLKDFDAYRLEAFGVRTVQMDALRQLGSEHGIARVAYPWQSKDLFGLLLGHSWRELNHPRQKEVLRRAFEEELRPLVIRPHTNLQLGDSGIAEHFTKLLDDPELNPDHRYKSVVGVYNSIARSAS